MTTLLEPLPLIKPSLFITHTDLQQLRLTAQSPILLHLAKILPLLPTSRYLCIDICLLLFKVYFLDNIIFSHPEGKG